MIDDLLAGRKGWAECKKDLPGFIRAFVSRVEISGCKLRAANDFSAFAFLSHWGEHPMEAEYFRLYVVTVKMTFRQGKSLAESDIMTVGTILFMLLILVLVGALPAWPHSRNWGYYPSGGLGLLLVIVAILLLTHVI